MKTFKKLNALFLMGFILMIAFSSCQKEQSIQYAWKENLTPLTEIPEGVEHLSFDTEEEANEFFEKVNKEFDALENTVLELEEVSMKDAPKPCEDPIYGSEVRTLTQAYNSTGSFSAPPHTLTASALIYFGNQYLDHMSSDLTDHNLLVEVEKKSPWSVQQNTFDILYTDSNCVRSILYLTNVTFTVTISIGGSSSTTDFNKFLSLVAIVQEFE